MAKEFRYLRILIVKTAIHQRFVPYVYSNTYTHGIGQDSAPIQYCHIADACVLGKQLWLPILCHL